MPQTGLDLLAWRSPATTFVLGVTATAATGYQHRRERERSGG